MNRLLAGIVILGIALVAVGCADEFLTTVPTDRLSSATFWESERDFNVALNAAYERMLGVNMNPMYFDGTTEIGYSHADWRRQHEYVMGYANAQSGWSADMWEQAFTGISRANLVLDKLKAVGDEVLSADAADKIRAQALFLRGYYYHELLWMFGSVPVFTSVPTVEEARTVSRPSREEVYAQIMADLSEAAKLLPTSWMAGRATKGAALGYQARTALYEASWQEYHEGNQSRADELYRTAAEKALAVMRLGEYSLHPNFRELFTYEGEGSEEIIFSYQKVSGENGWPAWFAFAPNSVGGDVHVSPTRELVKRFPMEDGLPIDESPLYDASPPRITYDSNGNPTVETLGMYANRDPRLYATVLVPGAEFNGVVYNSYPPCSSGAPAGYCSPTSDAIVITNYSNTYTGYISLKYVDPQDQATPMDSGINIIKMRYAGILLMYAEAKAELGEVDGSVVAALTKIRDRVNLPMPDITTMSQEDVIAFIRNERTIELAFEGLHLADIRRWATAEDVLNGRTHGIHVAKGGGTFEPVPGQWTRSFAAPRDYLWPIPAGELGLNSNLVQNPGY